MKLNQLLVLVFYTLYNVECAKILGVFHFPSKSHHILGSTLLKALAKRGHQVTMLSPFPLKNQFANYEDIEITGMMEFKDGTLTETVMTLQNMSFYKKMSVMMDMVKDMDERILANEAVQNLVTSGRKFDLVIQCYFGNNAYLALPYLFEASSMVFSTVGANTLINRLTGNSAPYSYVPNMFPMATDEMTFTQRLLNSLSSIASELYLYYFSVVHQEHVRQKYFPTAPSVHELLKNVTLVLLNSHYSIESPRPYLPSMIQVGGLHVEEPKELRGDIKEFMDSAVNGVVLFSLGSNAKSSMLAKATIQGIIDTFGNMPYKVLWKFESGLPNLPKNVKIARWLPQRDVLAHPNIKLFVTHGGLLSTTEAVYHGVPMVGIPIFGDQESNVNEGVIKGYMVKVDFTNLTRAAFSEAINEALTNPKYRDNVKYRSLILRDQQIKPLDRAIYWVEYVLRHKGAHHLKSTALKLQWYQYYLLDVVAFLITVVLIIVTIGYFLVLAIKRLLQNLLRRKNPSMANGVNGSSKVGGKKKSKIA